MIEILVTRALRYRGAVHDTGSVVSAPPGDAAELLASGRARLVDGSDSTLITDHLRDLEVRNKLRAEISQRR